MNFFQKIKKRLHVERDWMEADALVLAILPGRILQLQVTPGEERNFITEINLPEWMGSIKVGGKLRVQCLPGKKQIRNIRSS